MKHEETLINLCKEVKQLIEEKEYAKAKYVILQAMICYADEPQPHNLMGILKECEHDHSGAMRHFRAGYALDPSYGPVRRNLETISDFYAKVALDYGDEEEIEVHPAHYPATYKHSIDTRL